MEELYQCKCGHQEFRIFADRIVCGKCGAEYKEGKMGKLEPENFFWIPLPRDFNNHIEALAAIKGIYPTGTARGM